MNILVTGCFGFLGYNFIKFLEDNDLNFIGIDSLETNSAKNLFEISKNSSSSFYNLDKIHNLGWNSENNIQKQISF